MAVKTVQDVLVAASAVTAIVGTGADARVEQILKPQNIALPAVTLSRIFTAPVNNLETDGDLDANRVQVDSWATTYTEALALSVACRNALQTAGHQLDSEFDNYDPSIDDGTFRVTQEYSVWT